MKTIEEIENLFGFHAGTDDTRPVHQRVRELFIDVVKELENLIPDTPEGARHKALMHTTLEDAAMWANKAVAMAAPLVKEGVDDLQAAADASVPSNNETYTPES